MKILLTGGAGSVGKAIIDRLYKEGDQVLVIGRREKMNVAPAEYKQCDINDFESLLKLSKGVDAIIHLAAIPSPLSVSSEKIFNINTTGTFNVFEAAARNGINKIASASSINAFGFNYGRKGFPVEYFPIDENTPGITTDVYSLSKKMGEDIAQYYSRWSGINSVSIRIPWVYHASEKQLSQWEQAPAKYQEVWHILQNMTEAERLQEVHRLIGAFDQYRTERYTPGYVHPAKDERTKKMNMILWWRSDFYTVIDERDCAQAFVKGIKADYNGAHHLYVNDSHNTTGIPTKELAELMYPQPADWKGIWKTIPSGTETLVSIDKARRLIGYEPEYSLKRFQ